MTTAREEFWGLVKVQTGEWYRRIVGEHAGTPVLFRTRREARTRQTRYWRVRKFTVVAPL